METSKVSFLRLRLSKDLSSLSSDVEALDIFVVSSLWKPLIDEWSDFSESCS